MRNTENINSVDALNPDYLGFIFYPKSPRFITEDIELPDTKAKKVGVFVDEIISNILSLGVKYGLQTIQLHGNESVQTCHLLSNLGYEVIKAFRIDQNTSAEEILEYKGSCKYFLFDTKAEKPGGTGEKFNWQKLNEIDGIGSYFLSGGIGQNDVETIKKLNLKNLVGIDINSRFEIEPALKDEALIRKFLLKLGKPLNKISHEIHSR